MIPDPDPWDVAVLEALHLRDGLATRVVLISGDERRVDNIAWGYDQGDEFAHVTSNCSPFIEGLAVDLFFTNDVVSVVDPVDGTVLLEKPEG